MNTQHHWHEPEAEARNPACREQARREIAAQVQVFLAKGGRITVLPAQEVAPAAPPYSQHENWKGGH